MSTQTAVAKKGGLGHWARSKSGKKTITTFTFLLVPLVLLLLFTIIPAINMVIFSFQSRDQFGLDAKWVGFDNYVTIFTQSEYWTTFTTSIYYFVGSFIQQAFALLVATILCSKIKFANFFKGVLFFPYMMNGVAVSLIFRRFFQGAGIGAGNTGTLNTILQMFGADPVKWLTDPNLVNICLVFASVWRYIGFDILMYIGAIQSIPPDIYEAADLDGANGWQKFRYIIFPSIRPIITLQLIMAIKGSISVYEIPYIITGGKMGSTTFLIKTMDTAFEYHKIGLASAMAIVMLIIILIVTGIQKLVFREKD